MSGKRKFYLVISVDEIEGLEKIVNDKIHKRWKCQGGVCAICQSQLVK